MADAEREAESGACILLVEDHVDTRESLLQLLENAGFDVITAGSADCGAAMLDAFQVDILICNVCLPDRSGLELMAEAKKRRHAPTTVAISGYGMADDIARAKAAGVDHYRTKPVQWSDLYALLMQVEHPGRGLGE